MMYTIAVVVFCCLGFAMGQDCSDRAAAANRAKACIPASLISQMQNFQNIQKGIVNADGTINTVKRDEFCGKINQVIEGVKCIQRATAGCPSDITNQFAVLSGMVPSLTNMLPVIGCPGATVDPSITSAPGGKCDIAAVGQCMTPQQRNEFQSLQATFQANSNPTPEQIKAACSQIGPLLTALDCITSSVSGCDPSNPITAAFSGMVNLRPTIEQAVKQACPNYSQGTTQSSVNSGKGKEITTENGIQNTQGTTQSSGSSNNPGGDPNAAGHIEVSTTFVVLALLLASILKPN